MDFSSTATLGCALFAIIQLPVIGACAYKTAQPKVAAIVELFREL